MAKLGWRGKPVFASYSRFARRFMLPFGKFGLGVRAGLFY